jgi:hypothetical protein
MYARTTHAQQHVHTYEGTDARCTAHLDDGIGNLLAHGCGAASFREPRDVNKWHTLVVPVLVVAAVLFLLLLLRLIVSIEPVEYTILLRL